MDALEVLLQTIDDAVQSKRDRVSSGQAPDYADYKKICGEIHGLLFVRQEVLDLKQKMENFDG